MHNRKRSIDWEGVQADYRAGILSLRDIAAQRGGTEGAIRKRAKREGWKRAELKACILTRSRALVCTPEPTTQSGTQFGTQSEGGSQEKSTHDEQIIDDAVRTQIAVVLQHRKHIRETRDVVTELISELRSQTTRKDGIDQMIEVVFSSSTPAEGANRIALKRMLSLASRATTAVNLVNALGKLTAMERQAFGLGNIESEAPLDPAKRRMEDEKNAAGRTLTDHDRAVILLDIIERAKRSKQSAPGTGAEQ